MLNWICKNNKFIFKLKFIILVFFSLFLNFSNLWAQKNKKMTHAKEWVLVWADEFDSQKKEIDPEKWTHQLGGHGWGNKELQNYTNRTENSRVENGKLIIESRKEDFEKNNYTSARLVTKEKWLYGRFEIKAKLPSGRGSWPAIWMLSDAFISQGAAWPDSGEIDIMEHVGFDLGKIHTSIHTAAYNWIKKTQKTNVFEVKDPTQEFHIYSIEWSNKVIDFLVDQKKIFSYQNKFPKDKKKWPFNSEFRLIINNAVGGFWGGEKGVDEKSFPQKMEVDYVRVYQLK